MAKLYKGKPAELDAFYTTLERMLIDIRDRKREKREQAVEALQHGIMHLADVRSLLRRMEYGEDDYFTPEAQATSALI